MEYAGDVTRIEAAMRSVGAVLGAGLSWSLIRARATGQVEVQ